MANGTYSPVNRFMNSEEVNLVLNENCLLNKVAWTLPILLQVDKELATQMPKNGEIALRSQRTGKIFAVLNIECIQQINNVKNDWIQKWFETNSTDHPGVYQFINSGDYIISGKPFLIINNSNSVKVAYDMTPHQTRKIFYRKGWYNIIGFHTRNVPHRAHEYIQKKALEQINADAIFISPVTGIKKKGDFNTDIIIRCYEELIRKKVYGDYDVLLGAFNTYSRYSGPREAVFSAICRKNFGCNYFIVGRDHTGVGNYYKSNASQNIFESLDLGIKILSFDNVCFFEEKAEILFSPDNNGTSEKIKSISGTEIREFLLKGVAIPEYLARNEVIDILQEYYKKGVNDVFHENV